MQYRTLQGTSMRLSEISFGAWAAGGWMWGGNEKNDAIAAIRRSWELGVNNIDTAAVYGQGDSESIVGEAIKDLPRDQIYILTKYGMRWDLKKGEFAFNSKNNKREPIEVYRYSGKESVMLECENSLRRLGTDYIDLYQIHWPDTTTPIQETMEVVAKLIEQGKVRYAGVSNYSEILLEEARKYIPIVSDQVPYSMIKRDNEKKLVPYCITNGISILAYSPMERGLLTGKIKPGHVFSEGDHRSGLYYFREENIRRANIFLDEIKPLAEEKGITLGQLALRWTLDQPGITIALAGARNAAQAEQNAEASDVTLSVEENAWINEKLAGLVIEK